MHLMVQSISEEHENVNNGNTYFHQESLALSKSISHIYNNIVVKGNRLTNAYMMGGREDSDAIISVSNLI